MPRGNGVWIVCALARLEDPDADGLAVTTQPLGCLGMAQGAGKGALGVCRYGVSARLDQGMATERPFPEDVRTVLAHITGR